MWQQGVQRHQQLGLLVVGCLAWARLGATFQQDPLAVRGWGHPRCYCLPWQPVLHGTSQPHNLLWEGVGACVGAGACVERVGANCERHVCGGVTCARVSASFFAPAHLQPLHARNSWR